MGNHPLVGRVEVVDTQEQADASRELVADRDRLVGTIGPGQQQARLRPGGRTTTQRFGRPSLVSAGESSTSSKPSTST